MCCISVRFLVIEPPEVIEQDLVLVSRWLCLAWQGRFLRFSSKDVVGYCQPGHLCVCVGGYWPLEDNFWELVSSFHQVGSEDGSQVASPAASVWMG